MRTILLFTILALSLNAFSQSKAPKSMVRHSSLTAFGKNHNNLMDEGLKASSQISVPKIKTSTHSFLLANFSQIQILDSLYTWSWDENSLVWKLDSRMTNVIYDINNNLISSIDQNWTGSAWVNSESSTFTYDANHNTTSELLKTWSNTAWVNDMMNIWTYDANGNETSTSTKSWDGSTWVNENQTLYTYNANNNPTSMIYQSWGGMDWENSEKITYTYDANYNLTFILYQVWDGAAWENGSKESIIYDGNNKKTSSLTQVWMGSEWLDEMKIAYSYSYGNLAKEVTSYWNYNEWENYSQKDYAYDAGNNLVTETEQLWDETQWVNFQKANYAYDQNLNRTNTKVLAWNGSTWLNFYEMKNGYDANSFVTYLVWKKWDAAGTYVSMGDSIYVYYHTLPTSTPDEQAINVAVYPNPCHGKLSLNSSNTVSAIEIYSLTGNRLYSNYTFGQQTSNEIDLTGYATGIYIMKIYYGTKFISRKIIVQ